MPLEIKFEHDQSIFTTEEVGQERLLQAPLNKIMIERNLFLAVDFEADIYAN